MDGAVDLGKRTGRRSKVKEELTKPPLCRAMMSLSKLILPLTAFNENI
jgi:hypothetical protein